MLRTVRRAVPVAILLAVAYQAAALAAPTAVSQTDNLTFDPSAVTVPIGGQVEWTNVSHGIHHTTTGDSPLSLWASPTMNQGATFTFTFTAAGSYPYHCQFHQSFGMVGTVTVPMTVSPRTGAVGSNFVVKVASVPAPSGFRYVVLKKDPGGTLSVWRSITTAATVFKPAAAGVYQFSSYLLETSNNAKSGLAPSVSIRVTGA